jgi:hypothetical protein
VAARLLDPRQIRTQNPNAAAGQAAVQKLAGAYGTPQVTGPGANAFDASQPVTPTATPGPHISDSPYGMGADFLGTGGPMVTSDPAEVNRMQGKAATPQEAEANRRAKEAAAQAPGYQPGVVDSVNPNPLVDPLRDAKNYHYDARNYMNPDGTVNKLREASAYSEYGAAERFNPLLAEQEANLGQIATAAGDAARAEGAETERQGQIVGDTTTAMQSQFLREANAPRADIDVMSGDAAGQQSTTLGRLRSFDAASGGASAAEVSARNQSNRDFANSLAIARSGGTASQRAWAERAAVAQNFERQAEVGRNLVAERAAEAERTKQRELTALQTEAGAAGGVDTTRLGLATTEADVDLRLQELADRYGVDMSQLGAQTYLQGQQLAGQLDAQAFNEQMTGYQLPYQAQQDIIQQGNFQQQLGMQAYGLAQGLDIQAQQLQDQRAALPWQIGAGVVGGLGSAGIMALSDERAKTGIERLRDEAAEAIEASPSYRYRYKPGVGEDPELEHAGPMAQELERTRFGRALVKTRPDGYKAVDTSRLSLLHHAALGNVLERLRRLEEVA